MPTESGFFSSKKQDSPIERYSINLMWINRTKDDKQVYIGPSGSDGELVETLLAPAIKWSTANPKGCINLWYDSVQSTPEAVENTRQVLSKLMAEKNIQNLQLRDIRDIPIVAKNPDVFSDQIPKYFRIDILKAIIVVDAIEREGNDAAVFSDLEVGDLRPNHDRMTKEELFSPPIIERLEKDGLLLNASCPQPFENQFLQLGNNQEMIDAIKHIVINANLTRAIIKLNSVRLGTTGIEDKPLYSTRVIPALSQMVYISMCSQLYPYYYAKKSHSIPIRVEGDEVDMEYDINQHGYGPLGLSLDRYSGGFLDYPSKIRLYYPKNHEGEVQRYVKEFVARGDVDVRMGNEHQYDHEITKGSPASGDIYQCTLMDVAPSTTARLEPE